MFAVENMNTDEFATYITRPELSYDGDEKLPTLFETTDEAEDAMELLAQRQYGYRIVELVVIA